MNKINWGIIGLGNIANKFAEGFESIDSASIKGVSSKNKDKLNLFKKNFNIEDKFCFNDYNDLISCPEIDIIYIALPNSLHSFYINECLKNKKNVLVEKPAFLNFKDYEQTKKILLDEKIYFTEGFMYRHLPYIKKLKEIINSNILGKVTKIESVFNIRVFKQKKFFGIKFKKPDYSNRLFNKELGGGAILDVGCYPLSLSTLINSLSYNVNLKNIKLTKSRTLYCDSNVDIFSEAEFNFDNKFISKITCSFKDKLNQNSKIYFEHGHVDIYESWVPGKNMSIEMTNRNEKTQINFKNNDNIYSYQITNISEQILSKKIEANFPSISINEIGINTKLLEDWINYK